ncbi:LysR family transcriptional regulator [Kitasatospora kifunensis]
MVKFHGASDLELRHLRAFLAVVDHRSFRGAAETLWISQSALSRTIAQLERIVGQTLLERNHRGVLLTEVGERLLPLAARALSAADDAVTATVSPHSTLRVGFSYNALGENTTPLVREFESVHPGVRVELRRIDEVPFAGIEDGRSHVAILRGLPADPRIGHVVLHQEPRVAALPREHPVAALAEVTMDDMRHSPLVVVPITGTTTLSLWDGVGQAPRQVIRVHNLEEWLEAIAAGRGIGLSGESTSMLHPHPWVVYRPVSDAPLLPVVLAWAGDQPHPLTSDFVDLAKARYVCTVR